MKNSECTIYITTKNGWTQRYRKERTSEPCPQSMGKMDFPMEVSVVVFEMA